MKVANTQLRTIQFCALQGWPLSTAIPSRGHASRYQSTLREHKPIQMVA